MIVADVLAVQFQGSSVCNFILLGPARDNAFQHVGQVRHRIDAVQLGCLDQCHGNRPMNGPAIRAGDIMPGF